MYLGVRIMSILQMWCLVPTIVEAMHLYSTVVGKLYMNTRPIVYVQKIPH